ncbi:MAG: 2-keto-4-pentenoate hydratase [Alphaproteobacteria bacterium]
MADLNDAIDDFWAARQPGGKFPTQWDGKITQEEAYKIQLALLDRHVARGDAQAGWKVGLTAKAIRDQFGFKEPVYANLFDHGRWPSGGTWQLSELYRPGWENELLLIVGKRLQGPNATEADARAVITGIAPAMELIEARCSNTPEAMNGMLADNGQQRAFIVGKEIKFDPEIHDLASASVEVFVDGVFQERAFGREVMGSGPLASLAWLANKLAAHGRAVEAGTVVMSGSFTRQYQLDRPKRVEVRFAPFGTVTASFV